MSSLRNRIVFEKSVDRGYLDLQRIYESKSTKHVGEGRQTSTKLDQKLNTTNQLNAVSARLLDANSILEKCCSVLLDEDATMKARRQMSLNLRKLLIPLNGAASAGLRDAATHVAPIAGCRRYHDHCEADKKKNAT